MTTTTIPAVSADDHHVSVPTTPPKLIVKQHDASSSFNVTDNRHPAEADRADLDVANGS